MGRSTASDARWSSASAAASAGPSVLTNIAVTEPLRNPHTVLGRDVPHEGAEPGENGNRLLVAVHLGRNG